MAGAGFSEAALEGGACCKVSNRPPDGRVLWCPTSVALSLDSCPTPSRGQALRRNDGEAGARCGQGEYFPAKVGSKKMRNFSLWVETHNSA